MKILKGDQVKILLGKDKGRTGEVLASFPKNNKIIVKGLNIFKKHVKPQNGQKGGIVEKERAFLVSKTALVCPSCNKAVRVGYNVDKNGAKTRICKKCQAPLISKK
ncbi:MAG: 50S ribosomal protein L24 [Candidatus Shapirobacteria bacterium]